MRRERRCLGRATASEAVPLSHAHRQGSQARGGGGCGLRLMGSGVLCWTEPYRSAAMAPIRGGLDSAAKISKHLNWHKSAKQDLLLSQSGQCFWSGVLCPSTVIFMPWQSGIDAFITILAVAGVVVVAATRAATGVAARLNTSKTAKTRRKKCIMSPSTDNTGQTLQGGQCNVW